MCSFHQSKYIPQFILIIMMFSWSHEQGICSFHESRLGKAFMNILINISNVCAIFLNLLIFPLKQFFYKIRYLVSLKKNNQKNVKKGRVRK